MLGEQMINTIKQLYEKDQKSIHAISTILHCSRNTVSKYLNGGTEGYHRKDEPKQPKTDAIKPLIEKWIEEDQSVHPKQRRTRTKIFTDLVNNHGYDGSYTTVKRVVKGIKGLSRDVFVPRHHNPAEYCEFDFGEVYVNVAGQPVKLNLHGFQLTYSNDIFGYVSERAIQEEIFESHKRSFNHFEGIAQKIRYDNLTQVVKKVLAGSKRDETESFLKFKSQFGFESEFCARAMGNQKGDVEGCIGYIRRNFFSPLPEIASLEDLPQLNQSLAAWCLSLRETRITYNTDKTVGEMRVAEKNKLRYLPTHQPEVGKQTTGKANHYSLVSVESVFYSVPVKYAYAILDVLVTAREIIFYSKSDEVARHNRSWQKGEQVFNPLHYLELYKKKPYALINGKPTLALPKAFHTFFEKSLGRGYRNVSHCIEILKLIDQHPLADISMALELAMSYSTYDADGVKQLLHQLVTDQPVFAKIEYFNRPELADIKFPDVSLERYNTIIPGSGCRIQ